MSVHKRTYRGYSGTLTPAWSRFLVLFRFSRQRIFSSKFQTFFYAACFFWPLGCLLLIYLSHNLGFLAQFANAGGNMRLDHRFFFYYVDVQGVLAFILTAFTGPGLVSPDLTNGALPLYFCRPFSRGEYVLGKASVLAIMLSSITWIPGLLLFTVQASLAGGDWFWNNLWVAGSIVLASWIWIAILSLLSLALSAWVRWKILAAALMLGIFFLGSGFAHAINSVMRTDQGSLIDLGALIASAWSRLFGMHDPLALSPVETWIALLAICGVCLLLLWRKIRAYEVVR